MSKGKEGIHIGRPHSSASDPKTHVTVTQRNSNGTIVHKEHSSTMGGIAIGSAQWLASQEAKNSNKK